MIMFGPWEIPVGILGNRVLYLNVLQLILLVFDVLFFISMNNYRYTTEEMEKPKKTGGRWLFWGGLFFAMGAGGFILLKTGTQQLNLDTESEMLNLFILFCEELMGVMREYPAALLIDGTILLVIAIAKKILRRKQIECWENRLDLDETWYGLQRFLVVLLPTLSTWFLTNAFVEHLTGVQNAGKIISETGLFGVSMTKDYAYRRSVAIFILNYFCTLGLMMYWRNISLIPKTSNAKIRMSLMTLPCVFLVNYVLVRAFYSPVADLLPPVMAVVGFFVLVAIFSPVYLVLKSLAGEETETEYENRMDATARQIEQYRQSGDYDRIQKLTEYMSWDDKAKLASRSHSGYTDDEIVRRAIMKDD